MADYAKIPVDIFNIDVGIFYKDADRVEALEAMGCKAEPRDAGAIASAHLDETDDGSPRFSFVIDEGATRATWAHECSHMADFLCFRLGIPINCENTEIRAYLVGHLMACLEEKCGWMVD